MGLTNFGLTENCLFRRAKQLYKSIIARHVGLVPRTQRSTK
ncbi:hypothetical protein M2427_000001 [Bradyrhizobium sp. BR13661]|nr:hypothetical protein [Bradyrhizobium sp. BR13661]